MYFNCSVFQRTFLYAINYTNALVSTENENNSRFAYH